MIDNIHSKWEHLDPKDGEGSKYLKFQLIVVKNLREAMKQVVDHGKKAADKLAKMKSGDDNGRRS